MSSKIPFAKIMHEEGVEDLRKFGLKVVSAFAKALYLEREAGKTTDEAMEQLDIAIQHESEALAVVPG